MDLPAYFRRIKFSGTPTADLATLQALQQLHPATIAFENIEPLCGRGVALDLAALQDKLVVRGRGGYCFEHNILLGAVLRQLGFAVHGLAARVLWRAPEGEPRPRTHMLLHVEIDGAAYVSDVGFGGMTPTAPLALIADQEQSTPHEPFRLTLADGLYMLGARLATEWRALYAFDLQRQHVVDYEPANWYVSTHPGSFFVNNLIVARAQPGARHALFNNSYSVHWRDGTSDTRQLRTLPALRGLLADQFNIRLSDDPVLDARLQSLMDAAR